MIDELMMSWGGDTERGDYGVALAINERKRKEHGILWDFREGNNQF